jgi:hypothetical protein
MVERTLEDVAAMLDDLWGVAFKLRNVLVLVETQLSGKDGNPNLGGSKVAAPTQEHPVPANPAGEGTVPSTPPPTGGNFIPGTESRYGETIQEGTKLRYHAGLCRTCGLPVRRVGKPAPGASGKYQCWPCIKKRIGKEAKR